MSSWFGELLTEWRQRFKSVQAGDGIDPNDDSVPSGALELLRKHVTLAGPRVVEVLRDLQQTVPDLHVGDDAPITKRFQCEERGPVFGRRPHLPLSNEAVPADALPLRRTRLPRGVLLSKARLSTHAQSNGDGCAVTAGALVERHYGMTIYCRCARAKTFAPGFFERFPPAMPLSRIQTLLKCSGCGEKGAIQTTIIAPDRLTEPVVVETARTPQVAHAFDNDACSIYPLVAVN